MLAVLRRRNFALLWLGQLISQIGDMVLLVGLPFYVYQLTGSLVQTGLMYIVETVPRILLGSLAGVFVDRWDRRWTMVASDLARAGLLLLLLLVRSPNDLWLVYFVAFLQSIISLFFAPALSAATPALVEERDLVAANSLHSLSESLMRFIGPPLGGALLALAGLAGVVLVDSASFLLSAALILPIAIPRQRADAQPGDGARWAAVWREWLDGLRLVRERPALTALFATFGLFAVSGGLSAASLIVFVNDVLGGTALTLGWMAMAQGAGSLIGAALVTRVNAIVRPAYLVGAPLVIAGCIVLLFTNIPILAVVLPLIALMGVFIVGFFVTTQTLIQLNVVDRYRGRVAGALGMTTSLMSLLGMLLASALASSAGAVGLLDCSGTLTALAGLVAIVTLRDVKADAGRSENNREPASPAVAL